RETRQFQARLITIKKIQFVRVRIDKNRNERQHIYGKDLGNPICSRKSCHCCIIRVSCERSAALCRASSALGRSLIWTKQPPRPAQANQSCGYCPNQDRKSTRLNSSH